MELNARLHLDEIVDKPNIAELLDTDDLIAIGLYCRNRYEQDKLSRTGWESRMVEATKLALQVKEAKTFPWQDASNIKFPLVTIGAIGYHARAYDALMPTSQPVQVRVIGDDPTGELTKQSQRISAHMSYQITEEDASWDENFDKLLLIQAISGCPHKKTYFDPIRRHNVSELVLPTDLVVNYWSKGMDAQTIVTHVIPFSRNKVYERIAAGVWLDWESSNPEPMPNEMQQEADEREGVTPPQFDDTTPVEYGEQSTLLDLDGDGYAEPYSVTFELATGKVRRIVARFYSEDVHYNEYTGQVLRIDGECLYTKFGFIPAPDGGYYDIGFGELLGPINESCNTLVNQITDAGTMYNTGGGFLGRGAKVRGGNMAFSPWEWKRLDSTGDDIRKNMMPLPVREPPRVLLDLLMLLINYGSQVAGSVESLSGALPGQNTPAENMRRAQTEGLKIFRGIYKRTWRALREEFRKLFKLNGIYLQNSEHFLDLSTGNNAIIRRTDYLTNTVYVRPTADPFVISEEERQRQAMLLREWAAQTPGADFYTANRRWLQANHVPAIDEIYPEPGSQKAQMIPPRTSPQMQVEQMKAQVKMGEQKLKLVMAQMKMAEAAELTQARVRQIEAATYELETKGMLNLAQAGATEGNKEVAQVNALVGMLKEHNAALLDNLRLVHEIMGESNGTGAQQQSSAVRRMASQPSDQGLSPEAGGAPGGAEGGMG